MPAATIRELLVLLAGSGGEASSWPDVVSALLPDRPRRELNAIGTVVAEFPLAIVPGSKEILSFQPSFVMQVCMFWSFFVCLWRGERLIALQLLVDLIFAYARLNPTLLCLSAINEATDRPAGIDQCTWCNGVGVFYMHNRYILRRVTGSDQSRFGAQPANMDHCSLLANGYELRPSPRHAECWFEGGVHNFLNVLADLLLVPGWAARNKCVLALENLSRGRVQLLAASQCNAHHVSEELLVHDFDVCVLFVC
jgi:hypothetical protein